LAILFTLPVSEARFGYEIGVYVNNSTANSHWAIGQSTEILKWQYESRVSGDGNSTKYHRLNGFAGMSLKEDAYSRNGRLVSKDLMSVASTLNWMYIDEVVSDSSNRYTLDINESLPTKITQQSQTTYKGEGIYVRSTYENNGEDIESSYFASALARSINYKSYYQNALIHSEIIPGNIDADVLRNHGLGLALYSASDGYTRLSLGSNNRRIEQSYNGAFTYSGRIRSEGRFNKTEYDDDMLECCPSQPSINAYNEDCSRYGCIPSDLANQSAMTE